MIASSPVNTATMTTILVVDDDPDLQLTIGTTLEAAGYAVFGCREPAQVSTLVQERHFEAMILDLSMPGKSGLEVLRELRSQEICPPTLILSASSSREDRVRGLRGGADDYLVKPFDPEELLLRLERIIHQTARPGEISSDLVTYPCWDLLQMLERGRHTGRLKVRSSKGTFQGDFFEGRALRAGLGHLTGSEALLALLGWNEGSFLFASRVQIPSLEASESALISSQDLLLQAAWMADELRRLDDFLPGPEEKLTLGFYAEKSLPEGYEALALDEVLSLVQSYPGMDLQTLFRRLPAAPRRIQLTVAKAIEQSLLIADPGTAPTGLQFETGLDRPARTDLVIEALLANSRARGRTSGTYHLLLMADPKVWPRLMDMLNELPTSYANGRWAALLRSLERTQGGTCRISAVPGNLHLHVQVLNDGTRGKAEKILPLCHGVVVWLGSEAGLNDVRPIIPKVDGGSREHQAWLVTDEDLADRVESAITRSQRWRSTRKAPAHLSRLLELLR